MKAIDRTSTERFSTKYKKVNGCWVWTASVDKLGFGRFKLNDKTEYAHRASYRMFVGEIPEGLYVVHSCRNLLCVNPEHLETVTSVENLLRTGAHPKLRKQLK
ncbi:MAG: HNH endonuclease signature motif containing protein [Ilumatobacteraceae bacterium]